MTAAPRSAPGTPPPATDDSVDEARRGECSPASAICPIRSALRPCTRSVPFSRSVAATPALRSAASSASSSRGLDADRLRRGGRWARSSGALHDQPAAVDDHDAVDRLRDLREKVARDEVRSCPARRTRGGSRAASARPRGRAVRGLVQHREARVAEQGRGESRGAGACRARAASRGVRSVVEVDERQHLFDAARASGRRCEDSQCRAPCAPDAGRPSSSTAPTRFPGRSRLGVTARRRRCSRPRSARPDRAASAASSSCRLRSGPRKPVKDPAQGRATGP